MTAMMMMMMMHGFEIQLPDARSGRAHEKCWTAIALSPKTWKPMFSGMIDDRARRQREHSHIAEASHTVLGGLRVTCGGTAARNW